MLLSPVEPQHMLVDVKLSFGLKITLATFKLAITVINSHVDCDLSLVERNIITDLTMVLDLSVHRVLVNLQSFLPSKLQATALTGETVCILELCFLSPSQLASITGI